MLTQKLLRSGFQVATIIVSVAGPATALAHTYVMQPPPRDVNNPNLDGRAHKTGPCGGIARTGKPTNYQTGEEITVKFQETIDHGGCFQIAFSPANDQNFVNLAQIDDPKGSPDNMVYTTKVKLPAGVTCKECTLVVRQLMLEGAGSKTCSPNMVPPTTGGDAGSTYFSCADICVGPECTDAGASPVDGGTDGSTTPGTDSGVGTTPTDGGGKLVDAGDDDDDGAAPNLRSGDGGGCSVALGATSGVGFSAAAGLLGLALLRRRRARKS